MQGLGWGWGITVATQPRVYKWMPFIGADPAQAVDQNGFYFPPGQVETGSHPGISTAFQHF